MARQQPPNEFHRVVVGCDGSPEGSDAVALGALLAGLNDAGLTLAGAYAYPIFPVPASLGSAELKRESKRFSAGSVTPGLPEGTSSPKPDLSVPRGLRRVVRRERADLIVLGSARDAAAERVMLGPRARQLLHHAPCAAVVAPRGYRERAAAPVRIGVGYDGGEESLVALSVAAGLAGATGGNLRILEVVDDRIPLGIDAITGRVVDWGALFDAESDAAREDVKHAAASVGVSAQGTTAIGDPGAKLRALSLELDLLVLGSLRFDRRERLSIGTTAESALSGAGCPVLVVPRTRERRTDHDPAHKRAEATA